jgi:hypothetical protein
MTAKFTVTVYARLAAGDMEARTAHPPHPISGFGFLPGAPTRQVFDADGRPGVSCTWRKKPKPEIGDEEWHGMQGQGQDPRQRQQSGSGTAAGRSDRRQRHGTAAVAVIGDGVDCEPDMITSGSFRDDE